MTTITMPTDALATAFVDAVIHADAPTLRGLLADDVWFRCLLPRATVEHHDAATAIGTMTGWFAGAEELVVEATHHRLSGTREHVGWRLRLRPSWAPETWHLIEQVGYVRPEGGAIRRIDLACTGFQPEE